MNVEQASKIVMQEPTRPFSWKAEAGGGYERIGPTRPAGVVTTACMHKGTRRNTGSPSGDCSKVKPEARERQAGPSGVTEGPVLPRKPGNPGGGKGPQLKGDARSGKGRRDW
jgi:hypothetical protein